MNFSKVINCAKLYDLYEQIFDYFNYRGWENAIIYNEINKL